MRAVAVADRVRLGRRSGRAVICRLVELAAIVPVRSILCILSPLQEEGALVLSSAHFAEESMIDQIIYYSPHLKNYVLLGNPHQKLHKLICPIIFF